MKEMNEEYRLVGEKLETIQVFIILYSQKQTNIQGP